MLQYHEQPFFILRFTAALEFVLILEISNIKELLSKIHEFGYKTKGKNDGSVSMKHNKKYNILFHEDNLSPFFI